MENINDYCKNFLFLLHVIFDFSFMFSVIELKLNDITKAANNVLKFL